MAIPKIISLPIDILHTLKFPYPSRVLAIPFIVLAVLFFTFFYEHPYSDLFLLVPSVFGLVLIYVFHHQIDRWWWRKYPPGLDTTMIEWLDRYVPYFKSLSHSDRRKYEERMGLFIRLKQFTLKAKKDFEVPEDVKMMVAAEFIRMSFLKEDYLLEHFDQVILYQHPFSSPQYEFLHTFELFHEDGVIVLSLEQLANGFNKRTGHFNLGLYAAVSAFIVLHPRLNWPDVGSMDEVFFKDNFNIDIEVIHQTLGFDWVNRLNILLYCYFEYEEKFETALPEAFQNLQAYFSDNEISLDPT